MLFYDFFKLKIKGLKVGNILIFPSELSTFSVFRFNKIVIFKKKDTKTEIRFFFKGVTEKKRRRKEEKNTRQIKEEKS